MITNFFNLNDVLNIDRNCLICNKKLSLLKINNYYFHLNKISNLLESNNYNQIIRINHFNNQIINGASAIVPHRNTYYSPPKINLKCKTCRFEILFSFIVSDGHQIQNITFDSMYATYYGHGSKLISIYYSPHRNSVHIDKSYLYDLSIDFYKITNFKLLNSKIKMFMTFQ